MKAKFENYKELAEQFMLLMAFKANDIYDGVYTPRSEAINELLPAIRREDTQRVFEVLSANVRPDSEFGDEVFQHWTAACPEALAGCTDKRGALTLQ